MKLALDASAALSAVLGLAQRDIVLDLIDSASTVIAPDLYASEVANGLWKYVSAGEITGSDAAVGLDAALNLIDRFVPVSQLAQEALREAAAYRHPVYDLCYAIAARREGCAVLTLDRKLRKLLMAMRISSALD